jgi:small subunit ribosomal protein S15
MSSEEKMKLELQRVRDEFKMSENDCGSARVQSEYGPSLPELTAI